MRALITGAAGFIGFHLAKRYLDDGHEIVGVDNLNDYYDVSLKMARLAQLKSNQRFRFVKGDVADREAMESLFSAEGFDRVLHMAAQAGVRYSLENPHIYVQSNVVGFLNILEGCRRQWRSGESRVTSHEPRATSHEPRATSHEPRATSHELRHLIYASSSSVYGLNTKMPFSVRDNVDHPISMYAVTKRADELMAHTYSHLYGLPTTGLRFFTAYGPWGRPDMALFKFTKAILEDRPIDVYNDGRMRRDFTYIDDVVEGVIRVAEHIPGACREYDESRVTSHESRSTSHDPRATSHESRSTSHSAPYRLYNIGNNNPVELMDFIRAIENALDKKARVNFLPMQPGDVPETYADVSDLTDDIGFSPSTPVGEGIGKFVKWYRSYYG